MKLLHFPLLIALALWLGLAGLASGQQQYDDVVIHEAAVPRPEQFNHGYVEYRFVVMNHSTTRTHQVQLVLPGNAYGQTSRIQRAVTLEPQMQAKVSLWQPWTQMHGSGAAVFIDGRRQREDLPVAITSADQAGLRHYSHVGSYMAAVRSLLISQGVDGRFRDELQTLAGQGGGVRMAGFSAQRSHVPVSQWSESWLGYSGFDGVMMTESEWLTMPATVQQAVWAWVETGGSLLVVGKLAGPPGVSFEATLEPIPMPQATGRQVLGGPVGLGQVGQIDPDQLLGWDKAVFTKIDEAFWRPSYEGQAATHTVEQANDALPVVGSLKVSTRGMLAIMLAFAVVIGPVNMFLFARFNRRIWTLLTIPLLAVLFSAGVFFYAILADGVRATGKASTWTILDQQLGRAVTVGWLGYYAPLQSGDGFRFDEQTALSALNTTQNMHYRRRDSMPAGQMVDWTHGQHLAAGWISARVPSHFLLRKHQFRRERLNIQQDDAGVVSVVNGLGSDLLTLRVADAKGDLHEAQGVIAAGARATLKPLPRTAEALDESQQSQILRRWTDAPAVFDSARETLANQLPPGVYVGTLRDAVFIEPGLARMKSWETRNVVQGRYAPAAPRE